MIDRADASMTVNILLYMCATPIVPVLLVSCLLINYATVATRYVDQLVYPVQMNLSVILNGFVFFVQLRKTIPCYQKEFSCGLPCGQPLPCGFHKCQMPCHPGDCLSANKKCTQACTRQRDLCGHPCGAPCHKGYCPDIPCKEMVILRLLSFGWTMRVF